MSLKILLIILCSACLTAIVNPLASHSHAASAGEAQMAQSGSMICTALCVLLCLINIISGLL